MPKAGKYRITQIKRSSQPRLLTELTVGETYGLSMRNSTRSLSNRNMSTRYHTTDTNTRHSDNDSFTQKTAEVNISPTTIPRTAPDTIRACS
jgi:hypothetical protein